MAAAECESKQSEARRRKEEGGAWSAEERCVRSGRERGKDDGEEDVRGNEGGE